MPTLVRRKRIYNPSRRRMTARQRLYFGTRAQRRRVGNRGKRRNRVRNVGEIFTIRLPNPTNRRSHTVARARRRRRNARATYRRRRSTRRYNPSRRRRYYSRARRRNPQTVVRYRTRRRRYNPRGYRSYRRRNPGIPAEASRAISVVAGAVITNYVSGMVAGMATGLSTGYGSWALVAAIAFGQGWIVGKVFKQRALGNDLIVGGLVYLVLKILSDVVPGFSLGLSGLRGGMGVIGNSSFYVPQVPSGPGKFGTFLVPPDTQRYVQQAIAASAPSSGGNMGAIVSLPSNGHRVALRRGLRIA